MLINIQANDPDNQIKHRTQTKILQKHIIKYKEKKLKFFYKFP